jgi:hypothetical protein
MTRHCRGGCAAEGRYERLCAFTGRGRQRPWLGGGTPRVDRNGELSAHLRQADLALEPHVVVAASRATAAAVATSLAPAVALLFLFSMTSYAVLAAFAMVFGAIVTREAILSYPKSKATRRATAVLRTSTEGVNMMIMSLRHESSLPKAMRFAARLPSEFGRELRGAIWSVVTGTHPTFEDTLHDLGARWEEHSRELKSCLHALITASCEGTEEGRRRALDRASSGLVAGARRRIEDYALGLSFPSMMLFSIGVLLPLMVGSFLPMLSWDMWTGAEEVAAASTAIAPDGVIVQTVLLMNVVFPLVALAIAVDAAAGRPISSSPAIQVHKMWTSVGLGLLAAVTCAALGLLASCVLLEGTGKLAGVLLSSTVPPAVLLILVDGGTAGRQGRGKKGDAGDALFRIGARMVEGENFESAVRRTIGGLDQDWFDLVTGISLDFRAPNPSPDDGRPVMADSGDRSVYEAAKVVMGAAAKDEAQAGVLAMDLSRYIRDVADLELTLKRRLRPTVSMMRFTTHVLAPIMLGITYVIYLSLASIGGGSELNPGTFFVVLGVFLVEINAVVAYFVWGINDRRGHGTLMNSIGSCMLVAELLYCATVLVAG